MQKWHNIKLIISLGLVVAVAAGLYITMSKLSAIVVGYHNAIRLGQFQYRGQGSIPTRSTPSVVEVAATETTVSFEELNTVTSITPGVFTLDLSATTLAADGTFGLTVNGAEVTATSSFATTFVYPGTTLELSFSSRQVAFQFTGEGSTEVTIPGEHTHLTVDGIETAVDIPGITTTLTVTGSTNVIVGVPETVTQMTIPSVEYVFTAVTDTITEDGGTKYCGDQTLAAGDAGNTCVMGTIFTVTLPSDVSPLYLHLGGLTTSFAISGITTTIVPEQILLVSSLQIA